MELTLATVLAAASIPVVAALVGNLVEYLQWSFAFFARINGRNLAFVLVALTYGAAWAFASDHGAEATFSAILLWVGCGMATMGLHQFQKEAGLTKPNKLED